MSRFDSVSGRVAGRASGRARRSLNVERVTEALGPLDTPADAERWLKQLTIWGCAGKVPGTVVMSGVRAVDGWLKVRELSASFEAIEALRADVRALGDERDRLAQELELARLEVSRMEVR